MRKFAQRNNRTTLAARLGIAISAAIFLAAFIAPRALMQEGAGQVQMAARLADSLSRATVKEETKPDPDQMTTEAASPLAPEAVTITTYPFTSTSGVLLEDMSSGTTTLVGANLDDNASAVTNIGFDYWLDGVRQTQFSINANGVCRLGGAAISTAFDDSTGFATVTNAPKIAAYFDDLWTGTNGKVHFKVVGSAPNRKLVVEWQNEQIPRIGSGNVGAGTFQMWLFETSGVIEFVYGSGVALNSANGGYTIGLQSGAATNFASVTSTGPTVSYAAQNSTQTNAITAGTAYLFTPNVPAAPTGLSFAPVTGSSIQLNWTDNATNEVGYVVYRSTDGINYSFVTQTAANAVNFNDIGLLPGTTYFYQVQAVTEGALSAVLAGSQATTPAGNISSTAAGGNWSVPATWVGGVVPTASDNVTIVDGSTVTIDVTTAVCFNLTVGQGASGVLQYIATPASTLTVGSNVSVAAGGTFTAGAGVLLTHVLNIGGSTSGSTAAGSLFNSGTFDMNTTAGVTVNFFGSSDGTLSGPGATCDFFAIVMNKGSSVTPVLDVTRVITIGAPAASANRLSATNGTFKLSSASVLTPWFGSQTLTATTGRLWLNNANASLTVVGVGTGTGAGAPTINGTLRVDFGTFGYGSGNNTMTIGAAGSLIVSGGTINIFGAIAFTTGATFTMTGGNINVDPQAANSLAATTNIVRFNSVNVSFTGGTLTIIDPHAATGTGVALSISTGNAATFNFTGSTISFGDGISTTAGSADGFDLDTFVGVALVPIGNVVVNNTATNAATRFVRAANALAPFTQLYSGDLNITNAGGSDFRLNGHLVGISGNVINNGTLNGSVVSSRLYFLGGGTPQTYSGTGTSVVPLQSFDVDNPLGVTINPAVSQIVTLRIILFTGGITNTNKLTLGNGAATSGIVQIGNTTTPTAAGNFDVPPVFNLGTAGQIVSYLRTTTSRVTGNEINPTRTLATLTYDDNDVTHTLTIAGGDITVTGTAALTNGRVVTGANNLIIGGAGTTTRTTGYVDGNFRKTYVATGSKTFEVGTANAYSPATMNVTALGINPSTLTVKAVQGSQPVLNPATSLQRYWTVTEGGDVTATMTFNYAADGVDVMGTEANYRVIRVSGGTAVNFPEVCPAGPCVDEAANTITIAGVTNFSDWTAGEPAAPTAAPATISGRVTTTSGAPMAGVTMRLEGGRVARTITDANGNYRLTGIDTDNFYTLTPSILNYHFSPASRSFSLLANMSDAVFTGSLNSVITGNVIDSPEYFVRQHYLDFLNREPDDAGLNFWSDQIIGCGSDFNCIERRTINVSAAYFLSIEFQKTGRLVDSVYRASYGRPPLYEEFGPDSAIVGRDVIVGNNTNWERTLAANTEEFLNAWVERPAFHAAYDNLANDGYVDALISHTDVEFTAAERATLVNGLTDGSFNRAQVLQRVAQNENFVNAKFNEAFVRMQYFGYLRRNPDDSGFHFWLNKLNEFNGNFERAEMVKAFLVSSEYRDRFRQQ